MRRCRMRFALLTIAVTISLLALAWSLGRLLVPPDWSPSAPLDLDAQPNFMTRYKLSRLSGDPELCASILAEAQMSYHALPD